MIYLKKIIGNWGIKAASGNYTLIYETIFKPNTPEAYVKEYTEGYYGSFDQSVLGLRRHALRDTENGAEFGLPEIKNLDDALNAIKVMDEKIIDFLKENKELVSLAYKCKEDYKLFCDVTGDKSETSDLEVEADSNEETSL